MKVIEWILTCIAYVISGLLGFLLAAAMDSFGSDNLIYGEPIGKVDVVVQGKRFAYGYVNYFEQPLWLCYTLRKEDIQGTTKRTNSFKEDQRIIIGSASPEDYKDSGYDKGHLCPASDSKLSSETMEESFLMSNICPQVPEFNRGIWKWLEIHTRTLAVQKGVVHVISGPVFVLPAKRIGKNLVAVPSAFYKVVYCPADQSIEAYLIPNQKSSKDFKSYKVTLKEVEERTGFEFLSKVKGKVK